MAVVKDSDLEVVLSLLEAALSGAFMAGGILDQWEEGTGNDLVEAGEAVARVSKSAGMEGGWSTEDIHWK